MRCGPLVSWRWFWGAPIGLCSSATLYGAWRSFRRILTPKSGTQSFISSANFGRKNFLHAHRINQVLSANIPRMKSLQGCARRTIVTEPASRRPLMM